MSLSKEACMPKTITLFLSTSPYSYENTLTASRIAESALNKGHKVNLVASADGVYCFLTKQKAKGILNAEEEFGRLIQKGLKVYL
jgi:sulfur relay (sulfurtransferase) complex TusBCD TusD component (DsrE family)